MPFYKVDNPKCKTCKRWSHPCNLDYQRQCSYVFFALVIVFTLLRQGLHIWFEIHDKQTPLHSTHESSNVNFIWLWTAYRRRWGHCNVAHATKIARMILKYEQGHTYKQSFSPIVHEHQINHLHGFSMFLVFINLFFVILLMTFFEHTPNHFDQPGNQGNHYKHLHNSYLTTHKISDS